MSSIFTDYTFQDWEEKTDDEKISFIPVIIDRYKSCSDFRIGLDANAYFRGENTAIMEKVIVKPDVVKIKTESGTQKSLSSKAVVGNRCASDFLYRFVVQQNQFLLGNGVSLRDEKLKKKLGSSFDTRLQELGENALLHGVAWGYWNLDHLEAISAVKDSYSGAVPLYDEMTSQPKVVIQFWQTASDKPMGVRLFEQDGVTIFRYKRRDDKGGETTERVAVDGEIVQKKRAYKTTVAKDEAGEMILDASNYSFLPVIPLYANSEKRSEFTHNIKSKIDAYDRIMSDFADNLDRANDIYWVLNNFGGTTDDVVEMIDTINRVKAVINQSNATGGGATAEPRTIDVPYSARQVALDILRKCLYQDYMALDMDEIHGGSLTNVAIQTATANMNLKADRYEWRVFDFIQAILRLLGVEDETEIIRFNRRSVTNDTEVIDNIYKMRDDVSQEWALKANPMINPDEVDEIIRKSKAEKESNRAQNNTEKGGNGDEKLPSDSEGGQHQQAQEEQGQEEVSPSGEEEK